MTALTLRILACVFMLCDHVGELVRNPMLMLVMRGVGRLAFPIFAFLIYNGFVHTSSRKRYALRLALFALISQIPFSLFTNRGLLEKGNVFFALLLALLCLWAVDEMVHSKRLHPWCWVVPFVLVVGYTFGGVSIDYGVKGVLLTLVFYCFERKSISGKVLTVLGTLVAMNYTYGINLAKAAIKFALGRPWAWPMFSAWETLSLVNVLALVFIFLYNGKRGGSGKYPKLTQYGFYLFYPVHLLALWAVRMCL
ncbi:MAG: hypothetical protein IIV87_00405 [Oscillospiraceae bacterium]|nr:hypothetical protein [Oscillospiraceae bacterium]